MEYEILNEVSRNKVQAEFEARSEEWSKEDLEQVLNNYQGELVKLEADIKFKSLAVELYLEDSSILSPVFAYEADKRYSDMLRDNKIPTMEQELMHSKGKREATIFQIGLMKEKIATEVFVAKELESIKEEQVE